MVKVDVAPSDQVALKSIEVGAVNWPRLENVNGFVSAAADVPVTGNAAVDSPTKGPLRTRVEPLLVTFEIVKVALLPALAAPAKVI